MRTTPIGLIGIGVIATAPVGVAPADTIELAGNPFIWSDAATWDNLDGPDRPPAAGDAAVFSIGGGGYNFFLDVDAACDDFRFENNAATWITLGSETPHTLSVADDMFISGDLLQLLSIDLTVGGELRVQGDAELFTGGGDVVIDGMILLGISSPAGDGTLVVSGGASSLSTDLGLCVGGSGHSGTFRLQGGATGDLQSLSVKCGAISGGSGLVEVVGGAQLFVRRIELNTDGGENGSGEIIVRDGGSTLSTTLGLVTIGATTGTSGVLRVLDDGFVNTSGSTIMRVERTGEIRLAHGGALELSGSLEIVGGLVESTVGGELRLGGGLASSVVVSSGGLLDLDQDLDLGPVAVPGFEPSVEVVTATARIDGVWRIGANAGEFGRTKVFGVNGAGTRGHLTASNEESGLVIGDGGTGELLVVDGGHVSGFSEVIIGNQASGEGSLTVEGTGGLGTRSQLDVAGDLVAGGANAVLDVLGEGLVAAAQDIRLGPDVGDTVTAMVGDGVSAFLFHAELVASGSIDVGGDPGGAATLTVRDNGIVEAGLDLHVWPSGTLFLEGGTLIADRSIAIGPFACPVGSDGGGRLEGYGTLETGDAFGATVRICGRLAPGGTIDGSTPGAATPMRIDVEGPVTHVGVIEMDLGGTDAGVDHDLLSVNGAVHLDGIFEVALAPGFAPDPGTAFDVIVATSITSGDSFDPQLDPGLEVEVLADRVRVIVSLPCPDVTGDGDVGFDDLVAVLGAWGPCPAPSAADLDGDGNVGFSDLVPILGAWGACP